MLSVGLASVPAAASGANSVEGWFEVCLQDLKTSCGFTDYAPQTGSFASMHEQITRTAVAKRLGSVLGFDHAGEYDDPVGCVANLEQGRENGRGTAPGSSSKHLELLGQR
jgi:hypothetical protein